MKITTIKYEDAKFKWVSSHWNLHLEGTCYYNGKLCRFVSMEPDYNEELDEWDQIWTDIYSLSWLEKINWLKRQWLFEKSVGYHWSYHNNIRDKRPFYYRKPAWLYKLIFKLYYKF